VYDISGRLVRTLGEGRFPAGSNSVTWDGLDDRGIRVIPGIYFYRLGHRGQFRTKKMILLR
jgi:flagellar hook assembly protein FlgD